MRSRRDFIKTSAAASGAVALGRIAASAGGEQPGAKSPNLLFVLCDQMRGSAMGFLGREPVKTPVLDRFSSESLVLTQAVSNYPVCSPYRGMWMSGKYPHSNKVISNCTSRTAPYDCELQESDRCWSDVLHDRGYSLGYIGKWHLDSPREPYIDCANNRGKTKWNEWCPPERRHGFDFWYSYGTYDHHMRPMYWSTHAARDEFKYVDQWGPEHEADLAIKYLRNEGGTCRKQNEPFGLVVSMNPPHMPYSAVPDHYVERYGDVSADELLEGQEALPPAGTKMGDYARKHVKNYFAMITGVDEQFGRILAALDEAGLSDDTIVVFTSDHGNCLGLHEQVSKNNHYDESLIVPFLVRWPGRIRPRQDSLLLSVPDIYPTLLDLMGAGRDTPSDVEGTSYASLFLTGKGSRPMSALYGKPVYNRPDMGERGIRTDRHTLSISRVEGSPDRVVLHDNKKDPFQLENIAEQQPELVEQIMRDELLPWLKKSNDPWRV